MDEDIQYDLYNIDELPDWFALKEISVHQQIVDKQQKEQERGEKKRLDDEISFSSSSDEE